MVLVMRWAGSRASSAQVQVAKREHEELLSPRCSLEAVAAGEPLLIGVLRAGSWPRAAPVGLWKAAWALLVGELRLSGGQCGSSLLSATPHSCVLEKKEDLVFRRVGSASSLAPPPK